MNRKMCCDTCGREAEQLRRDVLEGRYNALNKPAIWNCDRCYKLKRDQRHKREMHR